MGYFLAMTETPGGDPSEWLASNAIDFSRSEIAIAPVQVTDHAWFNCETGALAVATEIYPPCKECELPSECSHFVRQNVISCMTGDGDGDYLVWALHSNVVPEDAPYMADGAFIILDSTIHATIKYKYGKLLFDAPPLAPISIGTIEVKEHVASTGPSGFGFLFIADQQATANSEYFQVDLPVRPGKYQIVAYMGEATFYDFTPRAIGIYGEFFTDPLIETLTNLDHDSADRFQAQIHGTEDGTVMSRMGNDLDFLSEKNSEISYNRGVLLSDSWAFQRYFAGSERIKEKIENFSPSENYTPLQWLTIADGLRIRGQKAESSNLINTLLGSSLAFNSEEEKYLVAIMRAQPGVWPA
jgi:hypothetical protein